MMADNASPADIPDDPPGWWGPIHEQVAAWVEQYADDDTD